MVDKKCKVICIRCRNPPRDDSFNLEREKIIRYRTTDNHDTLVEHDAGFPIPENHPVSIMTPDGQAWLSRNRILAMLTDEQLQTTASLLEHMEPFHETYQTTRQLCFTDPHKKKALRTIRRLTRIHYRFAQDP